MKSNSLKAALVIATGLVAMSGLSVSAKKAPVTKIEWTSLGNVTEGPDKGTYTQRFIVTGNTDIDKFCFNQFARGMNMVTPGATLGEIIPGYYEVTVPADQKGRDTINIDIRTRGTMRAICYSPDGVHGLDATGKPFDVEYVNLGITDFPAQWSTPDRDNMPKGPELYELNERLAREAAAFASTATAQYAMLPTLKDVRFNGKTVDATKLSVYIGVLPELGDTLKLVADDKSIDVLVGDNPVMYDRALRLVHRIKQNSSLPQAKVVDYPDYGYRGAMIDISRNYQNPVQMRRIVDQMSRYGLNRLQFHLADDEAWRLEIPGLPELTTVGSRKGYTKDDDQFLAQTYRGNGNPDAQGLTSNGYFTRREFIDFLKYADSKGITVVTEIESPGHARAAIKAMNHRAKYAGDDSYVLVEKGDTSRYTSAQAYHDNVMNPALDGPYKFMAKVIDEIEAMYREAGVELPAIHIGGDEVPRNAWGGSPAVKKLMKKNKMKSEKEVHAYFVKKVNDYLLSKNLKIAGWSEIGNGHSEAYDNAVAPNTYFINCWHNYSDKPESEIRQALRRGYPALICNVDYFYLDMMATPHPEERGLNWGGYVDDFKALSGTRDKLAKTMPDDKANVIGVSGQLWAETIQNAAGQEYSLFPKMLALAERGWNADSTITDGAFVYMVENQEIPQWQEKNINFRVLQPGVKAENGKVVMNAPYQCAQIRYTLDGSRPDVNSALYEGPVEVAEGVTIKAACFFGPVKSVTTIFKK